MRTHTRHILMCTGPRCTEGGAAAEAMFKKLGEKIDACPELQVKRTRTHCMVVCKDKGPFVVIYPEGTWYRCKTEAELDRVVQDHLREGREVPELLFHRIGSGDVVPAETP